MNSNTASIINWLAILASTAALAVVIANIYQRGFFSPESEQEIVVSSQPLQTKTERVSIEQIVNAHLFGQKPVGTKPVKKVVAAPKTRLKLTLTGLFEDSNQQGRAIIEVQGGKTIVVKVGDQIAKTGAKLHQIEFDHVLIDRSGSLERLPMVRPEMTGMSALVASVQSSSGPVDESSLPQPREEEFVLPEPEPVPQPQSQSDPERQEQESREQASEQNAVQQQQQQQQQQLQQGKPPSTVPQPFGVPPEPGNQSTPNQQAVPGQGNPQSVLLPPANPG